MVMLEKRTGVLSKQKSSLFSCSYFYHQFDPFLIIVYQSSPICYFFPSYYLSTPEFFQMKYLYLLYSVDPTKIKNGSIQKITDDSPHQQNQILVLTHPNLRVFCDSCLKNITLMAYFCAEESDYCASCFANLDNFPSTYSVQTGLNYSLLETDWITLDQILLLNSFEKWGFGNWDEITDFMNFNGAKFTKTQIEEHYDQFYLDQPDFLPSINQKVIESSKARRNRHCSSRRNEVKETKSQENITVPAQKKETPPSQANVLGYNPKRKCFNYDIEFDEKAQSMLADIQFKDDDTEEQIELKFQIIEAYNKRLDQRQKIYKFTLDHHILDIDYRYKKEFSTNKYEKEAFNLYRPFTRFQSHEENEKTMELIADNSFYRSMIQGLKKCRRKIDKEGRVEETLKYLKEKEKLDILGKPRKIYHIDTYCPSGEMGEEEILKKIEQKIENDSDGQSQVKLRTLYRSF